MTSLYLRLNLADNGCTGLIEVMSTILLFILFAVTIPLSFMATFRKRQLYNKKPEPITLTITILALCVLIIGKVFGEGFKGRQWIYAKANIHNLETQALTLRKNGTFRVDLGYVDFSCFFSGQYQKYGDTIFLDIDVVDQTNSSLTSKYLLQDTILKPISDTKKDSFKFSEFVIISRQ